MKVATVCDTLPVVPPSHEIALGIFLDFQTIFCSFEKSLNRERTKLARQRRTEDPNIIFKDLARPRSLPVQTILAKSIVHVSFVSSDHKQIDYTPVRLDTTQPVFGPMGLLMPDQHEAGRMHFRFDPQLQLGDTLVQETLKGELNEVFEAFHNLWSPRWNKHQSTTEEKWKPFAEFVRREIPQPSSPLVLPEITVDEWIKTAKAKKSSTATGPDGISKSDLVHMPLDLVKQLVRIFNAIEHGQPWPKCLLTGLISATEKTENAKGPGDYRPITVLSLAYRVWATIRSRQILTDVALGTMAEFAELLDIELDGAKSFVWSTNQEDRAFFRSQGHQVLNCARDLGGHLNYNKQNTLHTIRARLVEIRELWVWLARSCAPLPQKLKALESVAWRRCWHSISTLHIAEAHFSRLRSAAMRSLHATKHGANPLLHLLLVCPTRYDPEFFAMWNTIKMFRKHCNPDIAFPLLTAIVNSGLRQYYQGPCGALLNCLTSVAWTWEDNHTIIDHEGLCIHILHTPIQTIKTRLIWAWQLAVGSKLCTRDEFNGIQYVDRELTMHRISKFPSDSQGLLRVVFNGTFYTRDKLYHNGHHPTRNCPFCGLRDGVYHRHWECEKFVDLCKPIPGKVRSFLEGMPGCMVLHGWSPRPSGSRLFSQLLNTLPDLTGHFVADKSEMEIFSFLQYDWQHGEWRLQT